VVGLAGKRGAAGTMKARIDAGTDVAMIVLWDAQRAAAPLTAAESKRFGDVVETDAAEAHVFVVHTGADGGGPVDVYVDEALPTDVQQRLRPGGGEFLLVLPTGALVVGGAEDYRAAEPRITGAKSSVQVPAGEYAVRCYAPKDEEQTPRSEQELRKLVGRENIEYYDRVNKSGCAIGAATLLLFPILSFPFGWIIALVITVVVFFSFFPIWRWVLNRNARYQRLETVITEFRLGQADPTLVFELRRLSDRGTLNGGSVTL
jgi:hypothetical protein